MLAGSALATPTAAPVTHRAATGELLFFAVPSGAKTALPSRTRIFGIGAGGTAIVSALVVVVGFVVGLIGLAILGLIRPGCGPPS